MSQASEDVNPVFPLIAVATAFALSLSVRANQVADTDELVLIAGLPIPGDPDALAQALNTTDWTWQTNSVGWFAQSEISRDGSAAQSGSQARGQTSSMETAVLGPGTVRFWWRTSSSDSGDGPRFFVNDSEKRALTGKKDWQLITYSISSTSTQRLRWDYVWDSGSSSSGATGWVEHVEFARVLPPLLTTQPLSFTNLAGTSTKFSVVANGGSPMAYQWRFNDANLIDGNGISGSKSSALSLSALQVSRSGSYCVVVTNVAGAVTSAVANLSVVRVISLSEALDATGLAWTTSGTPAWFGQTNVTHDGEDAAQSGAIGDGKSIYFNTNVTGPGTISFWWKVSSETNNDLLLFQIGGIERARISGEMDWAQAGPFAVPSGSQSLRWTYKKGSGGKAGADAGWVDQVIFIPPAPSVTSQPASQIVYSETTVSFAVKAGGMALNYQWLSNGIPMGNDVGISGANTSTLTLAAVQTNQAGGYSVIVNNLGGAVTSAVAVLKVNYALPLADALDTPGREWANITAVGWNGQAAVNSDSEDAAESGAIGNSQSTTMQTFAVGPGNVSFFWKVSSQRDSDLLRFYIGSTEMARISGESNWSRRSFTLAAGSNVLKWTYSKNSSSVAGADRGWVDQVQFSGPLYNTNSNALPGTNEIATVLHLANDYYIANNTRQTNGWARGVYQAGNTRAFEVLGTQRYYDWAVQWGTFFNWQPGWRGPTNADGEVCGQAYVDLYRVDPQPIRIAAIHAAMDNRVAYVKVDDWWWIDAFFMAGPVYARFGNLYQTNSYFDKLFAMYQDMKVRRGLYDATDKLWYRDADAQEAETDNGQKQFWGRGNGWVIAACARVLEQSPLSAVQQAEYTSMLQNMAAVLKPLQGSDGFWRASLFDAEEVPNPETSGTALFTYAMAWGIRNGVLDAAEYQPVVARAWNGMVRVALHGDGKLGYVQPQGKFPEPADYDDTSDHGVGAFLLAGSEVLLLSAAIPEPPAPLPFGEMFDGSITINIELAGDLVVLKWKANPGRSYRVFYKDNLLQEQWKVLDSDVATSGSAASLVDKKSAEAQRFYRVEEY